MTIVATTSENTPNFLSMPLDVHNCILRHLDLKTALAARASCKRLYYVINKLGYVLFKEIDIKLHPNNHSFVSFLSIKHDLDRISSNNPTVAKIAEMFRYSNVNAIPILDVRRPRHVEFGKFMPKEIPEGIYRGLDPLRRPFIALSDGEDVIVMQALFNDVHTSIVIINGPKFGFGKSLVPNERLHELKAVLSAKRQKTDLSWNVPS